MRLNKYLSHAGVSSRRKCDVLIKSRKVKVNGHIVEDFSYQVQSEDIVQCNGEMVNFDAHRLVYLINKPKGYISTSSTVQANHRVIDLLPSTERLFTIGRLDRDTTGAILVTNDGDLSNKLMHPRFKKEKIYLAETKIDIQDKDITKLEKGLRLEGGERARGKLRRLDKYKGIILWEIILTEGKNREVKRIFEALGSKVQTLHRHSFAGLTVDNIKVGKYKLLDKKTVQSLV